MTDTGTPHSLRSFINAHNYSIDNGAMIAWTGLLAYKTTGEGAALKDTWCTQRYARDRDPTAALTQHRFRTDEVDVTWRND
jgi:tRNA A37 threonylcarbamoyltransferase TsaD